MMMCTDDIGSTRELSSKRLGGDSGIPDCDAAAEPGSVAPLPVVASALSSDGLGVLASALPAAVLAPGADTFVLPVVVPAAAAAEALVVFGLPGVDADSLVVGATAATAMLPGLKQKRTVHTRDVASWESFI
jgi:hypothetical protein